MAVSSQTGKIQIRMDDNSSPVNPTSTSYQSYRLNIWLIDTHAVTVQYIILQQPLDSTDSHATSLWSHGFRYSRHHLTCIRTWIIIFSRIPVMFSNVIFGDSVTGLITSNKDAAWARSADYRTKTALYCLIWNHDNLLVLVSGNETNISHDCKLQEAR